MSIPVILIMILAVLIGVFLILCITHLNMKVDAAYIIGFCTYFDMFGYLYKRVIPGNALLLLIVVPFIPALIAWFSKGSESRSVLKDHGIWLWGAVLLYALASLTWAPPGTGGLSKLIILIVHAVIPGLYAYIIYKKHFKFSWTILALFGLAFAIAHLIFGEYSSEYPGRLTLPGTNPIFNARMSLFTITICLWGRKIPLFIRIVTIAAAAVSAFATESRGPIAAFIIANMIIAIIVVYAKFKRGEFKLSTKYLLPLLLLLAMGATVVTQYSSELEQWIDSSRFSVLFDRNQLQGDDNYIGRMDLQQKAFEKWNEHPFIGGGLGSVTPPLARDFPHNVMVEIVSELGILGLILWSFAFLYSLWVARRHLVIAALLLQTLGTAMLSGDFGFNFEYVLIAFLALTLMPDKKGVAKRDAQDFVSDYRT